jgi:hypothetical protein
MGVSTVIQAYLGYCVIRQITDFYPGYIAERACREELLDLAGRHDDVAYNSVDNDNVLFLL